MKPVAADLEEIEDMPRSAARPLDSRRVEQTLAAVTRAAGNSAAFQPVLDSLTCDELGDAEVVEVARRFTGEKIRGRKAAIKAIGQEHLRLAHQKAKRASAGKTRVW